MSMKIINQVITLDQAKRLKELGITQYGCAFAYNQVRDSTGKYHILDFSGIGAGISGYAAFTVAELGLMLPYLYDAQRIPYPKSEIGMWVVYNDQGHSHIEGLFETEAIAKGSMLMHLLEEGELTADEVNARLDAI